jgi:hypothetical protein
MHESLKACNGQVDDLTDKIHGILVEGYEDSIQPLLLRQEMYGHMQEACRLDEMEASKDSKDVRQVRIPKRLWRKFQMFSMLFHPSYQKKKKNFSLARRNLR